MAQASKSRYSTVDPEEISHFSKDSGRWWDENGPFAPLHRLNPVRMKFIRDAVAAHFNLETETLSPLKGLKILDIGCGGGLVSEPLARMGATVTGIDADETAIKVAQEHAKASGLKIDFSCTTTDILIGSLPPHPPDSRTPSPRRGEGWGEGNKNPDHKFDVVLALEIVEHVASVDKFVDEVVGLCRPGGLVIFSTLNRTPKSFALGIVAAEYILRWVPTGTHNWKKFVRPSELAASLRHAGATPVNVKGMRLHPLKNEFEIVENDLDVNYFMVAQKH